MCGICGLHGWDDGVDIVGSLVSIIAHRGPDDTGVFWRAPLAMGAARLSLVAPEAGEQPFEDARRDVIVLFNGEIYNHLELRSELVRDGECFATVSEVEVIAALYRKYGDSFAEHLEGMFAIAIADGDKLVLVRDCFGIKPLFFYQRGKRFAFASEMKALLPLLPAEPTINVEVLEEVLVFGYPIDTNETVFLEISQVAPGEVVRWVDGKVVRSSYRPSLAEWARNGGNGTRFRYKEDVSELAGRLSSAVDVMWRHGADTKGIYLSGGLDSSLLAVLAAKASDGPIATFTLTDGSEHPDSYYADMVARAIGSHHSRFVVTVEDYLDVLPHFIAHYEGPMAGGVFDIHGGIAFHLLSREIGKCARIAFSGEGADELFGGYRWIHTHPLGFSDRIRSRTARVRPDSRVRRIVDELFPVPEDEDVYRSNLFQFLHGGGLANYHLASVDRSCGAFGFEVRPPYLHPWVAEFACQLPLRFKVPDRRTTKRILRDVARIHFEGLGIGEVISRPKQGMPAAVAGIAPRLTGILSSYGTYRRTPHPYEGLLTSDADFFLFDLFYYLMVSCRGRVPDGFSVEEFVAGGTIARLHN